MSEPPVIYLDEVNISSDSAQAGVIMSVPDALTIMQAISAGETVTVELHDLKREEH